MAVRAPRGKARASRRKERLEAVPVMLPTLVRNIPLYEVLNAEGEELIHDASMKILEEVGIEFRDDEAIEYWKDAGAEVNGYRVRIQREMLLDLVDKAPEEFTLHGRNPQRTVEVGGKNIVFAPTYGSPFVLDFDNRRRYSTLDDLHKFHKLAHMLPSLHVSGGITCEPIDVAVSKRHLRVAYSALTHSDKPFMGATTARERAEDTVAMAKIALGEEYVDTHTVMVSVCNCNSPLVWDATMLDAVKVYAKHNQPVLLSPFVLAGASTPASTVGSVTQINAEALAGISFSQLVRPGCPMIYGHYLATVSMQSGAPMAGTPETAWMNYMTGQMARRYKVPWRSSGMLAGSKLMDAQAAYESNMTMHACLLAGANFVFHTTGWLEAGLCASFAKFVLDAEQMEMFYRYAQGPSFEDLGEAMDALREIGPGSHYLGTAHTLNHFQSAFYIPQLLDNNSFEQWEIDGAMDANTRALNKAQTMLDRYQAPPMDAAIDDELKDFMARREAVLPDEVS